MGIFHVFLSCRNGTKWSSAAHVLKLAYFERNLQASRVNNREFLGLKLPNFQGIVFI